MESAALENAARENAARENAARQNAVTAGRSSGGVTDRGGPRRGRMVRKGDLPSKPCLQCGRPMVWRRKWARDWDQVKYCSDRCRAAARA